MSVDKTLAIELSHDLSCSKPNKKKENRVLDFMDGKDLLYNMNIFYIRLVSFAPEDYTKHDADDHCHGEPNTIEL